MAVPSDPDQLAAALLAGDRRALARAITLVEGRRPGHDRILTAVYPASGRAHVVGITGPPGAGKSTVTDQLIRLLRGDGAQVGVVAVDPSSPFTGGAMLGDRIRMQDHASDPGVYIRSMSNRGHLGGLAVATSQAVTLLDAAGFDLVLVETVGVGQAEVEVADTADTTVVVLTPAFGDSVQAEKAGLLEVADVLCVNQADRSGADDTRRLLQAMLDLAPPAAWRPPVVSTVAITGEGVAELAAEIRRHRRHLEESGELTERRRRRARRQLRQAVEAALTGDLPGVGGGDAVRSEVEAGRLDPWTAARRLLGT